MPSVVKIPRAKSLFKKQIIVIVVVVITGIHG
jgi:hypothetical protein